jgi:hypothetical protein
LRKIEDQAVLTAIDTRCYVALLVQTVRRVWGKT